MAADAVVLQATGRGASAERSPRKSPTSRWPTRACRPISARREAKLETLRADHYAAGDALHERQGAFYEANAEVTRLEQQLAFARESETRITQQVAQITEQIGALAGQESALLADRNGHREGASRTALSRSGSAPVGRPSAPAVGAVAGAGTGSRGGGGGVRRICNSGVALAEQSIRVIETRRENVAQLHGPARPSSRTVAGGARRAGRADHRPDRGRRRTNLRQETAELASKEAALNALHDAVQGLQERQRATSDAAQNAGTQARGHRSPARRRSRRCRRRSGRARTARSGSRTTASRMPVVYGRDRSMASPDGNLDAEDPVELLQATAEVGRAGRARERRGPGHSVAPFADRDGGLAAIVPCRASIPPGTLAASSSRRPPTP